MPEVFDLTTPSETIREIGLSTEFKGQAPDVPIAPGVDIDALTSGVNDPVFVTLKIAQIGRKSKNGILYDEALVKEIVEQINRKRSGGIFGHIPASERDSAFPLPDGLWVGATLTGDTAWGKAYVRNLAAAEYVRHLKAVGGGLGTSIYGLGIPEKVSEGVRRLKNFVLESLDFAPPERASLDMGGEFALSSEMTNGETTMTVTKEALAQLPVSELYDLLDESTVDQVAQMYAKKKNKKVVAAELVVSGETGVPVAEFEAIKARETKLLREKDDLTEEVARYRVAEFNAGLAGVVDGAFATWQNLDKLNDAQKLQFNAVKAQLRGRLVAELSGKQDLALAKAKADAIMTSDEFRPVVEMMMTAFAGGNALAGGSREQSREAAYASAEARAKEWVG